ncbi:MAG TPA: FtsX-like permease family protein [Mucilaginibacter sp.]|jgi:putative ABC transport system permease protein
MFKHLFKLIWNKKKQNFLLISEMLISFMVIFAVFTLVVYYCKNYKKSLGFDFEDRWIINYNNANKTTNIDSLNMFYETLIQTMKSMPQVKGVTFTSDNVPFVQNTNSGQITYNKKSEQTDMFTVDDSYRDVLNLQITEGRWFNKQDIAAKYHPTVINSALKEAFFGDGTAVGKLIGDYDGKNMMRVIGVVTSVKAKGDYATVGAGMYRRTDTGSYRWLGKMLVKVAPDADAAFEGKLYKTLANYMKNSDIEIEHMVNKRTSINYFTLVPMIVLLIVACFLIINVAMGLFGVLWYNINKRRGEIGLRRAVGATGRSVSSQLVAEAMILATFSLIIGSFFAIQFPLLNVFRLPASVYLIALFLSIAFIYLLVLVCSLYPGKQAAAIYPAVALHEE